MAAPGTKAIIFDCFGVLYLDTHTSLLNVVDSTRHRQVSDLFMQNNRGYLSKEQYIQQLAGITELSPDAVLRYISAEHHLNVELMQLIRKHIKPHYRVGLLSNIGRGWIDTFFTEHELHDVFDQVVLSGDEGIVKPDTEIFMLTADRLGVQPDECLMIDDRQENCEGAVRAGMAAIEFTDNTQLLRELQQSYVLQ